MCQLKLTTANLIWRLENNRIGNHEFKLFALAVGRRIPCRPPKRKRERMCQLRLTSSRGALKTIGSEIGHWTRSSREVANSFRFPPGNKQPKKNVYRAGTNQHLREQASRDTATSGIPRQKKTTGEHQNCIAAYGRQCDKHRETTRQTVRWAKLVWEPCLAAQKIAARNELASMWK